MFIPAVQRTVPGVYPHLPLNSVRISVFVHGCDGDLPKMEWVSQALQFAVVVKRCGPGSGESQPLQELDFFAGGILAHR